MFTIFKGANLVEKYQKAKREKKEAEGISLGKVLKIVIPIIVALIVWFLPATSFGIADLTVTQQRVMAIFVFAIFMWIMEGIPSWSTSMVVVVLLLFTCSDSSLAFLTGEGDLVTKEGTSLKWNEFGTWINYKSIMHCFADPIIMLFIGGFILAIAATKTGLDSVLARVMLKPFGTKSENVLLGFLVVTGIFSMFLSNTATAAMMLAFLTPVLRALPADGKGKIALALAIPIAANVGGIGTPIGTPPNAIALKFLNDPEGLNMGIGFGQWMAFMMPFTLVLLFISWMLLKKMFPFKQKTIELQIDGEFKKDWRSIVVYVTFGVTILLWMLDKVTGVNSNVVAMLPVGVFCAIGVITRRDLEQISWSVLWMVAGGFALGVALKETGLGSALVSSIPFGTWPPVIVIIGSGLICYAMANFISHTATANLLVPILALLGAPVAEGGILEILQPVGGISTLLIGVALGSSLAMILPISTPPNAMAHATGMIEQKDMIKTGIIIGIIGLVLGYGMLILLGSNGLI